MNPAKAAPSAPVKKADDQQDTGHADEHHGQGGHPGRKMKHRGIRTLDLSDANRTLSQQYRFCAHLLHCEKKKINVYSSI